MYIHISKQGLLSYRQSRSPRGSQSSRATRSSAGTSVLSANISRSSVPPRGSPSPRIGMPREKRKLIVRRVVARHGFLSYRQSRSHRRSQSSLATRSLRGTSVLSAKISRSSVPPRGSPSPRIGIYIHTYKQREKEFKLNRLDVSLFVFARFNQNRWAAKRRRSPAL